MPPHSDGLAAHPAVSISAERYSKDPARRCGRWWPGPDLRRVSRDTSLDQIATKTGISKTSLHRYLIEVEPALSAEWA